MENGRIRVLIVEDDDDFAHLIRDQLSRQDVMEVVGRAYDRRSALSLAQSLSPQVVLMDLSLSTAQMDVIETARDIRIATDAKVVILTVYEEPKLDASCPSKDRHSAKTWPPQSARTAPYLSRSSCAAELLSALGQTSEKACHLLYPDGMPFSFRIFF